MTDGLNCMLTSLDAKIPPGRFPLRISLWLSLANAKKLVKDIKGSDMVT